jgi:transcriptional regulator with XRE-family HTH domain
MTNEKAISDAAFATRLKQLRKDHGYTQAELAKRLEMTPTAISTWERGASKPRMDVVYKMAKLYNVQAGEIVGDTSPNFQDRLVTVWKERRPDIRSQRELERELGLGNGTITKWSQSSPSQDKLQSIADFFGVSVDYLLGNSDDMHSNMGGVAAAKTIDLDQLEQYTMSFQGADVSEERAKQIADLIRPIIEVAMKSDLEKGKK